MRRCNTVVLGGSGVAGTGIVGSLLEAGTHVDVIDLQPPTHSHPNLGFIEADLREPAVVGRVAEYEQVVVAFGLLARGLGQRPRAAYEFNLNTTLSVVEAARRGHCRRFVFLSSAMVYDRGRASGPLAEEAAVVGRCGYTHSKLAVEHALRCAVEADMAPTLVLRPFTIFGPGPLRGDAGHLVGRWLELVRAGEALTVHGDGTQTVDLVPSSVLGDTCARFFTQDDAPALQVLNGTCGRPTTIRALAQQFCRHFPGATVRTIAAPPTATPSAQVWGDGSALEAFLGAPLPEPSIAVDTFLAGQ